MPNTGAAIARATPTKPELVKLADHGAESRLEKETGEITN